MEGLEDREELSNPFCVSLSTARRVTVNPPFEQQGREQGPGPQPEGPRPYHLLVVVTVA